MAYSKARKVDTGIWRLKDRRGYVAEVGWTDQDSPKRVRKWQSFHRKELAQEWRRKMQDTLLVADCERQMMCRESRSLSLRTSTIEFGR